MTGPAAAPAAVSALQVVRRGLAVTPGVKAGLAVTALLAVFAGAGRIVVPLSVQLFIDHGVTASSGLNLSAIVWSCALAVAALGLTALSAYGMNVRLVKVTETALATLRTKAFEHVHRLSMLDQQEHRRGALVSRITGDVDQISQFLQWGGLLLLTSVCQVVLATVVMAFYSWQLTLLVLACFVPLIVLAPRAQRRLSAAYRTVRERAGGTLSAISESVTGATVVRAYGAALRTRRRVHSRVRGYADQQVRAQRLSVLIFSGAEVTAGVAMAGVIVFGFILGVAGRLTLGELTGFLFLITLFIAPVQLATEILNEAQNAAAGWRRVLGVLDMTPSVTDPGGAMQRLPAGELGFEVRGVGFSYLDGPPVLHDVNVVLAPGAQIAIVGETGSGKTTFAKLVTRLADPTLGEIRVGGVDLREISFAELRSRVAMVPQDAFLFNTTVRQNVTLAKLDATDADLERVFADLGLTDWAGRLPQGLDTQVGERGDALSAGERQLVAIARAYLADPSVLVLDEATSAVDPATDVRLQRAMDRLCRGRTTLTIAHRLFTAESADEVLVFDAGRLVQRGAHDRLVNEPASIYQRLHASWAAHAR